MRITANILRFRKSCWRKEIRGSLQGEEIKAAEVRWLKIALDEKELRCSFQLKVDNFGLFRCHGRIIDYNPIHYHKETLHGGVQAADEQDQRALLDSTVALNRKVCTR